MSSKSKVDRQPPAAKHPKLPAYSQLTAEAAQVLQETIATGGPRAATAYSALTALAVLWAHDAVVDAAQRAAVVAGYQAAMNELYPDALLQPVSL